MSKFIRFVLIVVIATVLGPVIGGLPFFVISARPGLSGVAVTEIARGLGILLLYAYVLGGGIAFIAGTIVAVVALWRQPSLVVVLGAAVVANVVWEAAILTFGASFDAVRLVINLVLSVFAATVCWLLFRRLVATPERT